MASVFTNPICRPDQIYHVSVMPCYDKKLEASRSDVYNEAYATRDVDCVITTGELDMLMREKGWDLSIPVAGEDETIPVRSSISTTTNNDTSIPHQNDGREQGKDVTHAFQETFASSEMQSTGDLPIIPELITHPGTSSGSYLHSLISLLLSAASSSSESHSSPTDQHPLELTIRTIRASSDYEEYTLTERGTGKVVFRGAKCYGFRNLQNVVRKVGREAGVQVGRGAAGRLGGGVRVGRVKKLGAGAGANANGDGEQEKGYDYVEVMACPGGCVNGGGQLRPPTKSNSNASSGLDNEEGFKRDWASTGVSVEGDSSSPSPDVGVGGAGAAGAAATKWGDREWTRKVEEVYWHGLTGLPTPPPSPQLDPSKRRNRVEDEKADVADRLAAVVLSETCLSKDRGGHEAGVASWSSVMDGEAETRRKTLFRTQYRAVESEVVGLAVKW